MLGSHECLGRNECMHECGCDVQITGSSKKRARHAGATAVLAEMLKNTEQSSQIQLLTSAPNNE